jgi:integrase
VHLTEKRVAKLIRGGEPGRHLAGGAAPRGLYLVVDGPKAAYWQLRYERHGKSHFMGLGSARLFALAEASARARRARQQIADGVDPLESRRKEQAAGRLASLKSISFAEAAKSYFEMHGETWRNAKHRAQFLSTLSTYAFPKIGALSVDAIDTALVLRCIEPIWKDKTETASRLRGRIESVLDWATVRGYRSGENPARWKGHLSEVLPRRTQVAKVEHHQSLPYAELPGFMHALRPRQAVAARALEFLILTAARTGEVLGAQWSEIDLAAKTWTVPAERMKAHREHRVPLSDAAVAVLRSVHRENGNPYVFIGSQTGTAMSNMSLAVLLKRMGYDDVTVHGFRSSFSTWAAEQTNYPREVGEQALAHIIPVAQERAYKRTTLFDKRRQLMTAWARFCTRPPAKAAKPATGTNVVGIHQREST